MGTFRNKVGSRRVAHWDHAHGVPGCARAPAGSAVVSRLRDLPQDRGSTRTDVADSCRVHSSTSHIRGLRHASKLLISKRSHIAVFDPQSLNRRVLAVGLPGFAVVRGRPAGHFPAMTRGHGHGRPAARGAPARPRAGGLSYESWACCRQLRQSQQRCGSPPDRGQEVLGVLAFEPFCQAEVPASMAVLACDHFCRASSLGGTSISLTQRRVAATRCPPPMAKPTRAISAPAPSKTAPVISGADSNCGPFCASLTAPSFFLFP